MACIGCGLRENGVTSDLEVATSEEWGSGALAGFGVDDTVGAPIYCDGAGQIRGVPEHTCITGEATGAGAETIPDGATVDIADCTLVVNNPSSVRGVYMLSHWSTALSRTWGVDNAVWTDRFVALRNGLAYFNLNGAQQPGNSGGGYIGVRNFGDTTVDNIAAGGSVTYNLTVGLAANGGTSGTATASVSIRTLAVTV